MSPLERRVNELAATMAKPLLLETEFKPIRKRLSLPPALPGDDLSIDSDD
jgi:hypothetical protein